MDEDPRRLRGINRLLAALLATFAALGLLRRDPVVPAGVPVEVSGAVARPGYHLVDAPTVARAVAAACGPTLDDDRPLSLGDHVVVAEDGTATLAPPSDPVLVGRTVDPNVASADAVAHLPGIGASLAARVVADREARGPFRAVDDLLRVPGLGPARLAAAAAAIRVDEVPLLDLNRATAAELEALRGVGPVLAERIVQDRTERGPFPDLGALARVRGVGPELVASLEGIAGTGITGTGGLP